MNVPQYLYATTEEQQRFFALLLQQIQTDLSDNGWCIPNLTQAQVDQVTSGGTGLIPAFNPVMKRGTIWFNTDALPNGKLQFITMKAIPPGLLGGPLDATYETVTSA